MPDRETPEIRPQERQLPEADGPEGQTPEAPTPVGEPPDDAPRRSEASALRGPLQTRSADTAPTPRPPLVGRPPPAAPASMPPGAGAHTSRRFPRNIETSEGPDVAARTLFPVDTRAQEAAQPEPAPLRERRGWPVNAYAVLFTALITALFLAFLLIEPTPRWLLLVGAVVTIFAVDGVLRATWREPFASEGDTTTYLFLPTLYVLAAPIIIEHNVPGYAVIPAGFLIGGGFGAVVLAELVSVRTGTPQYPTARLITTAGAYFVLFALTSMTYVFGVDLSMALLAVALLTLMLGVEVLREGEVDRTETLVLATVSAAIVTQARWVLHYLPIDGYLAGLALTLVFFLTTGLLHAYVQRQFSLALALEYTLIAAAGAALIVTARITGLA